MRIDVDTGTYGSACSELYDANHGVIDAVSTLNSTLGTGSAMAGTDTGGEEWGTQYDQAAQQLVQAGCDLGEAMGQSANLLNASLKNHDGADYGARLDTPPQYQTSADDGDADPNHWTETLSPARLPSSKGGVGGEPGWWHWIASHLEGLFWPDADTGKLRSVGQAWATAGDAVGLWSSVVDAAKLDLQLSSRPRSPTPSSALAELSRHTSDLADAYRQIGKACTDYAQHVDDHHRMIEDELASLRRVDRGHRGGRRPSSASSRWASAREPRRRPKPPRSPTPPAEVVRILRALLELARPSRRPSARSSRRSPRSSAL